MYLNLTEFSFLTDCKIGCYFVTRDKKVSIVFEDGSELEQISQESDYTSYLRYSREYSLTDNLGSECDPINQYTTKLYLVGWGSLDTALSELRGRNITINSWSENSQKIQLEEGFETDKPLFKIEFNYLLTLNPCSDGLPCDC